MANITGSAILARALRNEGTDVLFFLMGGPMLLAEACCIKEGIRPIDVRHEQAAAFMGQAYSRLLQKPSVCMAASGPGVINLTTGIANALIDCAPVVAIGGSSAISQVGRQQFQEIDQLAIMKGCTKWADRIYNLKRIPEQVNAAFQKAMSGKPGPVYLDFPGDILYQEIPEEQVNWSLSGRPLLGARPMGEQGRIDELIAALAGARQPIILSGSGVLWSQAWDELRALVERAGIPFYTTPQGRGVLPDDHELSYLTMRSAAFRDADLILIVGTRMNYIIGHAEPPRFAAKAKIARIDIDADEIASSPRKVDIGIVGDCKMVLQQVLEGMSDSVNSDRYAAWRKKLSTGDAAKRAAPNGPATSNEQPIHPLRLCEEVKNFMQRDAILVVDGQEILNYGRQSMPTFVPGHRLNSGPFGTMGVGLPFGLGAKVARPDKQVIVVHGDGSFGLNAMELDTAVRHKIPVLVIVSLNGGWTADPTGEKPGRNLGYTRYDKMAEGLGCYGEYVERPEEIGPALRRAQTQVEQGRVALVNVKTDYRARAGTVAFASYST
ncbi:MAG: thiamine pyrophosphate-binding protein [Candidatus Lambdaproteobacteria bacterium]|nr:thiamine pyrophosphate-binding protein [Candidatus Lambdaproteobacteria bacterium]